MPNGWTRGDGAQTSSAPLSRQNSNAPLQSGNPPPSPPPDDPVPDPEPPLTPPRHTASHRVQPLGTHEHPASGPQSRIHAKIRTYTDDERTRLFPRLSKPLELMRNSYDCVVIGSGYGGAVAASRMARAHTNDGKRKSVCVLERGKERWPGEYPSSGAAAVKQLHMSGDFAPGDLPDLPVDSGDPTGMFHLIFGKGMSTVVCNGLGGTSLINANVFLEADQGTLSLPFWPQDIRENPTCLDEYYEKARKVLDPRTYPEDWPRLPKVELLKRQAEMLGLEDKFHMVPQTTRFRNGPNSVGVEMSPSALTGQDATGLNDGSKTTTLVTYLADAWNWGADMFCECEVRHIEKAEGRPGYIVYFSWHGRNRGKFKNVNEDLLWVHARECVFLGAGAIGTTEILLRSKELGLSMSERVGQNMSGNGDMLAFGYDTKFEANAIGKPYPSPYKPIGPTINSIIDCRGTKEHPLENPLHGFVIEEGAIPKALVTGRFLQALLEVMPGSQDPNRQSWLRWIGEGLASAKSWIFGPYVPRGAMEKTEVYLVMSHDSSQATMTLQDNKPVMEFSGVGQSETVQKIDALLEKAIHDVGGTFVPNPFFALMGKQQVSVHPIGGACMGDSSIGGATNHRGEVFTGKDDETHDGLIVMDAALIPGALGVNPFATITALAERNVHEYAGQHGLTISEEENRDAKGNRILDLFGHPQNAPLKSQLAPEDTNELREDAEITEIQALIQRAEAVDAAGFGFTEVMTGFIHKADGMIGEQREVYETAYRTAKSLCEEARFFLSIKSYDTRVLVKDDDHDADITGTFVCSAIPGSPFMVRGKFGLFTLYSGAPGTRNLTYDFDMEGVDGKMLHFYGYKVVDSSVALAPVQFWKSTSTLYATITDPNPENEPDGHQSIDADDAQRRRPVVVAKGIMHIRPRDFATQVLTMTPTGSSLLMKAWSALRFMNYFTSSSLSLFLAPFTPLEYPTVTYRGFINDTNPDESFVIVSEDTDKYGQHVRSVMHMWQPTHTTEDMPLKNLFMIPGASVDHQIFALPTIPYNAVNYFTRAGYRVFVCVTRIGQLMIAENPWTTYDARWDIKGCLKYIRENFADGNTPDNRVYTIAHCMGSVAFSTGLLEGTIPASWIHGISCSQVFMNPIWVPLNKLKVMAPGPLDRVYKALAGEWFACSTSPDDSLVQKVINELLRFYPEERREICNNATCHRVSFVFGRCWNHRNLNENTHRQIDRFFGGVNMTLLALLMTQGFDGYVMNDRFEKLTTKENIQRLKGIPFLLFVGGDNAVLSGTSTEKTYEILCDTFGTGSESGVMYRRHVVPHYGHLDCWMGKNAWKDVYPFVREEVDRVVRGEKYKFKEPDDRFKEMVESGELLY